MNPDMRGHTYTLYIVQVTTLIHIIKQSISCLKMHTFQTIKIGTKNIGSKLSKIIQPFFGIAASLVYILAMDWYPLTSPERRRFPITTNENKCQKKGLLSYWSAKLQVLHEGLITYYPTCTIFIFESLCLETACSSLHIHFLTRFSLNNYGQQRLNGLKSVCIKIKVVFMCRDQMSNIKPFTKKNKKWGHIFGMSWWRKDLKFSVFPIILKCYCR